MAHIRVASASDTWDIVASPNVTGVPNYLFGVAVRSSDKVVAVGSYRNDNSFGSPVHPLIERWNGSNWSIISSPSVPLNSELFGVTAVPTPQPDAQHPPLLIAVGYQGGTNRILSEDGLYEADSASTLIERSTDNGLTWTVDSAPSPGTGTNWLRGVTAIDENHIWAVGFYRNTDGLAQTLVLYWNGTSWAQQPSYSSQGTRNVLDGVSMTSATSGWAVGYSTVLGQGPPFILHLENGSWNQYSPVPAPGSLHYLGGVTCITASDCWAVGTYDSSPRYTLTYHWNGQAWNLVSSPDPLTDGGSALAAVDFIASDEVWSVGYSDTPPDQTLTERWYHTAWSIRNSANNGPLDNLLTAVAVVHRYPTCLTTTTWAVGYYGEMWLGGTAQTLIERYVRSGPCEPERPR